MFVDKSFSFPVLSTDIDATSIVRNRLFVNLYRLTNFFSFVFSLFFCFKSFGIGVKESEIDAQITKGETHSKKHR